MCAGLFGIDLLYLFLPTGRGTGLGWSGGYDDLLYAIAEKYDTVTYPTPPPARIVLGVGE